MRLHRFEAYSAPFLLLDSASLIEEKQHDINCNLQTLRATSRADLNSRYQKGVEQGILRPGQSPVLASRGFRQSCIQFDKFHDRRCELGSISRCLFLKERSDPRKDRAGNKMKGGCAVARLRGCADALVRASRLVKRVDVVNLAISGWCLGAGIRSWSVTHRDRSFAVELW